MIDYDRHIINDKVSILEAILAIDNLSKVDNSILTLFVCNKKNEVVGTLTDGDIRRGFINKKTLENGVSEFMSRNFTFLYDNDVDVRKIRKIKKSGINLLPILNNKNQIVKVFDLKNKKNILPLECVIMAGGKGERLRPLTENTPKPMLKLGTKPILEHNIDRLIDFGIEKIYISINYLGDQIKEYFGDGSKKGISIEYIEETNFLGTGGALGLVDNYQSNYLLVMNSDLFTDADFEDLFIKTIESEAEIGIASIPYTVSIPYAIFEKDDDKVISFKEKPSNTHYANAGIYILKTELIEKIPKNKFYNITDLIQDVLDSKQKVIQNPIIGYWIDIGKHEDYQKAKEIVKHIVNGS